jgi:hypothetical protein
MANTMMEVKAVDVLSLQARLDQIEAGIDAAHSKLDGVASREGPPEEAPREGAQAAAQRCQHKLEELNQRLINISELVGTL